MSSCNKVLEDSENHKPLHHNLKKYHDNVTLQKVRLIYLVARCCTEKLQV